MKKAVNNSYIALMCCISFLILGCNAPDTGLEESMGEFDQVNFNNDHLVNREYTEAQLREMLTPVQYRVTQEEGTERPFFNEYYDNHAPGIYVDIVSGEPLFSSIEKYDSGTGWPSFTAPLVPENIIETPSNVLWLDSIELKSKGARSHLGHILWDGPNGAARYCINSAALNFIHKDDLEEEGFGEYKGLFE